MFLCFVLDILFAQLPLHMLKMSHFRLFLLFCSIYYSGVAETCDVAIPNEKKRRNKLLPFENCLVLMVLLCKLINIQANAESVT